MIHSEGALSLPAHSEASGARLYRQSWFPDQPPRASILLAHGYAEHSGRYAHVAKHCTDKGYVVHALDHWGHGKSDGTPGYVPRFSVFIDGVLALREAIAAEKPELPVVLLGHSMGGLIACQTLLAQEGIFVASVLSGPAIVTAEPLSPFMLKMAATASKLAPKMGVMELDANGVSRDPDVVRDYVADPLNYHGKVGARLGHELLAAGEEVQERGGEISLPMLIIHGDTDKLAAPEGSQLLYDRISSQDKRLILYPGLYHEIFNEPEQQQVLNDMTDWLEERLP